MTTPDEYLARAAKAETDAAAARQEAERWRREAERATERARLAAYVVMGLGTMAFAFLVWALALAWRVDHL